MAWDRDKKMNRRTLRQPQKEDDRATGWLVLRGYGGNQRCFIVEDAPADFLQNLPEGGQEAV